MGGEKVSCMTSRACSLFVVDVGEDLHDLVYTPQS
jgi:hypothetical protein